MSKGYLYVAAVTLAASIAHFVQQDPAYPPKLSPETQAAMEAHTQAIQPGPQHVDLMRFAGEFTTKESLYLPGTEKPQVSDGTATIKSEMGGRFLVEHNNGALLGEPYVGVRIYGYSNGAKEYEGVWTYSGSTGIMNLTGKSADGGKMIDFTAHFADDVSGKPMTMSVQVRLLDPDHFEVELKGTMPNGTLGVRLVTVYTRKS